MQYTSPEHKVARSEIIIKLSADGRLYGRLKLADSSESSLEGNAPRHTATNIIQVSSAGIHAMVLGEYELSWSSW